MTAESKIKNQNELIDTIYEGKLEDLQKLYLKKEWRNKKGEHCWKFYSNKKAFKRILKYGIKNHIFADKSDAYGKLGRLLLDLYRDFIKSDCKSEKETLRCFYDEECVNCFRDRVKTEDKSNE